MSLPFYKFISFFSAKSHILTACLVELVSKQFHITNINTAVSAGSKSALSDLFSTHKHRKLKVNLPKTLRNGTRICLEKAQGSYKRLA